MASAPLTPQPPKQDLADLLLAKGVINAETLAKIRQDLATNHKTIQDEILQATFLDKNQQLQAKSIIFNTPFIRIEATQTPVEILNKIPQEVAKKYMTAAFEETPEVLRVAMADPLDIQKIRFITTLVGKRVEPYFADPDELKTVIDTRYGAQVGNEVNQALADVANVVDLTGTSDQLESVQGDIAAAPVARIINMLLEYAVRFKASDIHIEPRENKIAVRDRINGVLSEKLSLPLKIGPALISRIKILSNLKIDEHRVPQDGRFQIKVDKSFIDLRVSVLPTVYGEKVVIRILEKGGGSVSLDKTGLRGRAYQQFFEALKRTQGIILVTGPTGSGKTVTLASSLNILNREGVNILTLEDPVEIRIDGVNQVQVNPEVGLTFAKGMRSFLRQDPNIIMVGEIRDSETAELAVQAALTGHLVLATLHTNSAATSIPRLLDMGVEPFLLSSTIDVTAAQRLVRRICENCRKQIEITAAEMEKLKLSLGAIKGFNLSSYLQKNNGKIILYKGQGCPECANTGYRGRLGIFEVMPITDKIRAMIISHEGAQEIEREAINEGMLTMLQDGFLKALEGITTVEEVLRVIN